MDFEKTYLNTLQYHIKKERKMKSKGKYLMNLHTGIIHSGKQPCASGQNMAEKNRIWSDNLNELENFFEGDKKKGVLCARCFHEKR